MCILCITYRANFTNSSLSFLPKRPSTDHHRPDGHLSGRTADDGGEDGQGGIGRGWAFRAHATFRGTTERSEPTGLPLHRRRESCRPSSVWAAGGKAVLGRRTPPTGGSAGRGRGGVVLRRRQGKPQSVSPAGNCVRLFSVPRLLTLLPPLTPRRANHTRSSALALHVLTSSPPLQWSDERGYVGGSKTISIRCSTQTGVKRAAHSAVG